MKDGPSSPSRVFVMTKHAIGMMLASALLLRATLTAESQTQSLAEPQLSPMPKGFDSVRENIARGKIETVEYESKTMGNKRNMVVYTPPEYSKDKKYPILYLLHGAKYNET